MWVFEDNLSPFLTSIGWIVGYTFDPDDWAAISTGLRDTHQEAGRWFDYEFLGRHRIGFSLARDPGSGVVFFRAGVLPELDPQINLATEIFGRFRLCE